MDAPLTALDVKSADMLRMLLGCLDAAGDDGLQPSGSSAGRDKLSAGVPRSQTVFEPAAGLIEAGL